MEGKAEDYKITKMADKPNGQLFFNKISRRSENRPNCFLIQQTEYGTRCCTRQWGQTREFKGNSYSKQIQKGIGRDVVFTFSNTAAVDASGVTREKTAESGQGFSTPNTAPSNP